MQRIPYGRNENSTTSGKPIVFLQHGLLDASHTWVINMPAESFGVSLYKNLKIHYLKKTIN